MKPVPFADKPLPVAQITKGIAATGRAGGILSKVAAGKAGHEKQGMTPVKSDRGNFKLKG